MPIQRVALAIHGGADPLPKGEMTPEKEARYRDDLERALRAGFDALNAEGGTSLDAVEAAIRVMEDSPLFNAGKGAAFTSDGTIEMDASIVEGSERKAGAVAAVTRVRNPISAARAVMERSPHVLLVGQGADRFAEHLGLATEDHAYFHTRERWDALQEKLAAEASKVPPFGTVGAVARDRRGRLAAGASTGGTTGQLPGRVGDTPLVGGGTYAEDGVCAVSCTGDGEYFIRLAVAHEITARIKHLGETAEEAARKVLLDLGKLGGEGGVIVLGTDGVAALAFHSPGMYRGVITEDGRTTLAIYEDGPGVKV